jgi:homoserine kinase
MNQDCQTQSSTRLKPCRYRLSAPSSTANLGPGFDCLGLALDQRNIWDVTLTEGTVPGRCRLVESSGGQALEDIPVDENHLFFASWKILHERGFGPDPFALLRESGLEVELRAQNATPISRGLGSSAALRVASAAMFCRLTGETDRPAWELGSQLEGHPDNSGPAGLGGMTLGTLDSEENRYRLICPPLHSCWKVAVAIPQFCLHTAGARAALPKTMSYQDAIFNMGRLGFLLEGLKSGDAELVELGCQDRWHQNQRAAMVPGLCDVMKAAVESGAAAAFLSGAGPTVAAFVDQRLGDGLGERVSKQMCRAFEEAGVKANVEVMSVDTRGLEVCRL